MATEQDIWNRVYDEVNNYLRISPQIPTENLLTKATGVISSDNRYFTDSSGNNNHVKFIGSHCATFDGADDYIRIGNVFDLGTSNFTVSAWFRLDSSYTSSLRAVIAKGGYSGDGDFLIYANSTNFYVTGDETFYLSFGNLNDDTWHHIVVVREGTELRGYLDDMTTPADTYTFSSVHNFVSNHDWLIGDRIDSASAPFDGSIADVRVFLRALTSSEITDLHNCKSVSNPKMWHPLAEGEGLYVFDKSGNNYDGTINNATLSTFWGSTQDEVHLNLIHGFTTLDTMTPSSWRDYTYIGKVGDTTNQFTKTGNDIDIIATGGAWHGAGRAYTTSIKGIYNLKATWTLNNGYSRVAYWLYKDGSPIDYDPPDDSGGYFPYYHTSGYCSYNVQTVAGTHSIDTYIDLRNAPDFDEIHFAIMSGDGTSSPYIEFDQTDCDIQLSGKIPSNMSGTSDVFGNTLTNTAGSWHNGAETKLNFNPDNDASLTAVTLGDDLITGGDFASWTVNSDPVSDVPDGWNVSPSSDAPNNHVFENNQQCELVSDGTYTTIYQTGILVSNKTYRMGLDFVSQSGSENIAWGQYGNISNQTHTNITGTGKTYKFTYVSGSNGVEVKRYTGVTDIVFDNVELYEVVCEAYVFGTPLTNGMFKRVRTNKEDRFLVYSVVQTGDALTQINRYIGV